MVMMVEADFCGKGYRTKVEKTRHDTRLLDLNLKSNVNCVPNVDWEIRYIYSIR